MPEQKNACGGCIRARALAWLRWPVMSVILAAPVVAPAQSSSVVLNDASDPPLTTPERDGFLDMIAGEAFKRVGVELRLIKLPAERGLIDANAGIVDGDMVRITGLEAQYPNLIRVPEKLIDWEFTAFSKDPSIPSDWVAMREHSVAYIKGWKIYEQQLEGAANVLTVDDPEQLFRLLDLDRVDVALYAHESGALLVAQKGLKDVRPLLPPLDIREVFIYLHSRHADLVPRLERALRQMKNDGYYQRVYREKLQPYRKKPTP